MASLFTHLALLVQLALFHLVGPMPQDLGVHGGHLSPCPGSAHCACIDWAVADPDGALEALSQALLNLPRTALLDQQPGYLHATASSALFGFVDDVELYADRVHGLLQARSISRLGDSDLGVNARRLASLAAALPG